MARPVYSIRKGCVQVAAWENTSEDGRRGYSFKLNRRYKDKKTGEWVDSPFFFESDLLVAAALLQQAFSDLCITRGSEGAASGRANAAAANPARVASPPATASQEYVVKGEDGEYRVVDGNGQPDNIPF